jgi:GntR family transcriptional regulator / MocR family aminotransferase
MLPVYGSLQVDKTLRAPIYIQLSSQIMALIKTGRLQPGQQLPSSRQLALHLALHRKSIVQAYEELLSQGWLESHLGSGTFVSKQLPDIKQAPVAKKDTQSPDPLKIARFVVTDAPHLNRPVLRTTAPLHLDDGFPDARLVPADDISRAFRTQILLGNPYVRLGYGETSGAASLRAELSTYLNETRGLRTTPENILITRGTIMGIHLACQGLVGPGDHVAITEWGWSGAIMNFKEAGALIHTIPTDENGLDVDRLEQLCLKKPIRFVYVTPHHHYPTTVIMRADKRLRLLALAEKFGFIVFEDDYDYDFHYESKPLLPLAGSDPAGMVLYCGSFTKTISPAFRIGYLVGPENVIAHLAQRRRIIDRQGDHILENAVAELLKTGVIQRHLRKSLRLYRERRDEFCKLLNSELGSHVSFEVPEGGMAVWALFRPDLDLSVLSRTAAKHELFFSEGFGHHVNPRLSNGTRLGFASSTASELSRAIAILARILT